jgi:hypothetical protein
MKLLHVVFAVACVAPAAYACGGSMPSTPTPPAAPTVPAAPTTPTVDTAAPPSSATAAPAASDTSAAAPATSVAKLVWKDMNDDQKREHMKTNVLPKMKESFSGFDAKKFGGMNCATCHGDGAKDGKFKMPNAKLPKLNAANGFKKHMDKKPEITKFMMEKVVPDMAKLLDEQPYDPKTNSGFGCKDCHQVDMK